MGKAIPGRFSMEVFGDKPFPGVHFGDRWNGWACPYFTKPVALDMMAAWPTDLDDWGRVPYFDNENNRVCWPDSTCKSLWEHFGAQEIDGETYYDIGAFCWCWWLEDETAEDANSNCLAGFRCPKCSSIGPFRIVVTTLALVTDDGTEDFQGADWDDDSYCHCVSCQHDGIVEEFHKQ